MPNPLSSHPDRLKWNDRYHNEEDVWGFDPSPLFETALTAGVPDGPALELACGVSGNALALAHSGRDVLAVDISDVALERLAAEAEAQGLAHRITRVQAHLPAWQPPEGLRFALVLCVMYWDPTVFDYACEVVDEDGIIAWQGFSLDMLRYRPSAPPDICLQPGEPASRLPPAFTVIEERDIDDGRKAIRRMIARRTGL